VLWQARRSGASIRIAHGHTTDDGRPATIARRVYRTLGRHLIHRHATAGVAVSPTCAAALFGPDWAQDERFRVIPVAVDLACFQDDTAGDEVRRELGLPPDTVVLGQIGRFQPVKNHAFSVRVVEALSHRDPRVRLVLIGDGPTRVATERLAEELGVRQRCVFAGAVGREDVPRLLAGLDLLLHPSLYEGLPVTLVEAQAAAVPALASATITREVEAVPGLVRFVGLGEGPETWAAEASRTLGAPRPTPAEAQARLAETDFDIRRSAGHFLGLYGVS
jgi:glycosyltransferase involved in cell wall biosynthesis